MQLTDLIIIGGGPVGLAALFRAGMHDVSARLIEASGQLGGQLTTLYPEKYIYDIFGLPKVLAKDLVDNLKKQVEPFEQKIQIGELVENISVSDEEIYSVKTNKNTYYSKTLILTTGNGIIAPRRLMQGNSEQYESKGIHYFVKRKNDFKGKNIAIVGGGDSAIDWALELIPIANNLSIIHRSDKFEAHESNVRKVFQLAARNKVRIYTSHVVEKLEGEEKLEKVTIKDWKDKQRTIEADCLLPMIGYKINLGSMADWGLELQGKKIKVNQFMATNLPGIFAAGDAVDFPGKIKMITTGFAEATIAVKSAVEYINGGKQLKMKYSSTSGIRKKQIVMI